MSYRNACPQQKCTKKNLLLLFVSSLGENRYFDWTIRAEYSGWGNFKIFITRWHYIELGNNTNSILSFRCHSGRTVQFF